MTSSNRSPSLSSHSKGDDGDIHKEKDPALAAPQSGTSAHMVEDMENVPPVPGQDSRKVLTEDMAYDKLGFSYSTTKKWTILTVIFIVQTSMNFNASIFANAIDGLSSSFNISSQAARVGQCVFLVTYAFGCELWAPWSEEIGRKPVLQASLFLVNIWQIPAALAPNFGTMVVARFLGGLSSAGGSVTLGMVADMWHPADQQFAVAYVVLSSVGGSVVGPIVGGFVQNFLSWRWIFWVQLIFGAFTQALHLFVPETRVDILLDREAKRRRESGEEEVWGPNEVKGPLFKRLTLKELGKIWFRPFRMFATEPIVLCLSLLSGFSDALIFTFLESYQPVFKQWNFSTIALGLAFLPLLIGYFIAWFSFMPFFKRDQAFMRKHGPDSMPPERRLYWLLYTAPLEAIGLFGFAWTSLGPPKIPWIAPLLFSSLVGIANYAIYMATIDYMVASYGPYSASATGGNGFARDFLAGIAAMYATPFYTNLKSNPKYTLEYPTTILACIAVVVTIPIYVFYWKGEWFRERSRFAQTLAGQRRETDTRRRSSVAALQGGEGEKV